MTSLDRWKQDLENPNAHMSVRVKAALRVYMHELLNRQLKKMVEGEELGASVIQCEIDRVAGAINLLEQL